MTLQEIKNQVREYYYMEDDNIIDVSLACIIANRLQLGEPVWLIIIGASSGGKSQILRPLSMTDTKYLHRVDDITENTFLSGSLAKGGKEVSLLKRIGPAGMIAISDLTILFSRNAESRNAILSQFRMLYDGEMSKFVGNQDKPVTWKGYLGVIAGGTPSIYSNFEEVADMGERFMYYRMKPYNEREATRLALGRDLYGKDLDAKLADLYADYIKNIVVEHKDKKVDLTTEQVEHIIEVAMLAEKIRTVVKTDKFTKEIERIPSTAMPMRTALQLMNVAKALSCMRGCALDANDMDIITWMGLSMANEEKRAVLKILDSFDTDWSETQVIADKIGLDTKVIRNVLQNLASTKVVERSGGSGSLRWKLNPEYKGWFSNEKVRYEGRERSTEEEVDDEAF